MMQGFVFYKDRLQNGIGEKRVTKQWNGEINFVKFVKNSL